MKLRSIGITAFSISAVLILIGGVLLVSFSTYVDGYDPSAGGGFALFILWGTLALGKLVFIAAASIWTILALIAFVSWFLSAIYRASSAQVQTQIKWGGLMLLVSCGVIVSMYSYQQTLTEEVAKRATEIEANKATKEAEFKTDKAIKDAQLRKEQELYDKQRAERIKIIDKKYQLKADRSCQILRDKMLGKYSIEEYPQHYVEYRDDGILSYTGENGWISEGKWSLRCTMPKRIGIFTVLKENIQRCQNCAKTDTSYQVLPQYSGTQFWLSDLDKKEDINLTKLKN